MAFDSENVEQSLLYDTKSVHIFGTHFSLVAHISWFHFSIKTFSLLLRIPLTHLPRCFGSDQNISGAFLLMVICKIDVFAFNLWCFIRFIINFRLAHWNSTYFGAWNKLFSLYKCVCSCSWSESPSNIPDIETLGTHFVLCSLIWSKCIVFELLDESRAKPSIRGYHYVSRMFCSRFVLLISYVLRF